MPAETGQHHTLDVLTKTHAEIANETFAYSASAGPRFKLALVVLGALFVLGIIGVIVRIAGGFDDREKWGYYGATFMFLLLAAGAAPIVSVVYRLVRNHFRRSMDRAAQLWAFVGPLLVLMFIPLLLLLPSAEGRHSIWFKSVWRDGWPIGAPHVWDMLAIIGLATLGLTLAWLTSLPDFALIRDRGPKGGAQRFLARLAGPWRGTLKQWRVQKAALGVAGALYLMMYVFTVFLLSSDFGVSFIPGWRDAIFPAGQAVMGFQSGLALVLLTCFTLRNTGFREYIGLSQFWSSAKVLLAVSLLWIYFWWSGFITFWYGRTLTEQNNLDLLMMGSYRWAFALAVLCAFFLPMVLLIPNQLRKSIGGPALVSAIVLFGVFMNEIRIYVAAFSTSMGTLGAQELEHVPAAHWPDVFDIFIIVGLLSGAVFIYLLATRLVPVLSIWEVTEGTRLYVKRTFMGKEVAVLAKPD